jgi:hypothetical protein
MQGRLRPASVAGGSRPGWQTGRRAPTPPAHLPTVHLSCGGLVVAAGRLSGREGLHRLCRLRRLWGSRRSVATSARTAGARGAPSVTVSTTDVHRWPPTPLAVLLGQWWRAPAQWCIRSIRGLQCRSASPSGIAGGAGTGVDVPGSTPAVQRGPPTRPPWPRRGGRRLRASSPLPRPLPTFQAAGPSTPTATVVAPTMSTAERG